MIEMEERKKPGSIYKEEAGDSFPEEMTIILGSSKVKYKKRQWNIEGKKTGLRYGDNPGQEAALYGIAEGNFSAAGCEITPKDSIISSLTEKELIETGKSLGKSNLTDVDSALNILKYFDEPTAVIMKHNNPSGVASRNSIKEAYLAANMADRIAAFGGVVVANRKIDAETADEICKNYVEVVAAPEFDKQAQEKLAAKKNMRLITIRKLASLKDYRKKRYIEFKSDQVCPDGTFLPSGLPTACQHYSLFHIEGDKIITDGIPAGQTITWKFVLDKLELTIEPEDKTTSQTRQITLSKI